MTGEIRQAVIDDAAGITRVDIDSHIEAYRHIFGEDYLAGFTFEAFVERWQRLIRGDPANPQVPEHVYVATAGGTITGYACFGRSRDRDGQDTAEIGAIYVHPSQWRAGTGTALMREAFERLRERGFTEATLWALEENGIGRAFYERDGWHLDGARRTHPHGEVEVRYRKRIEAPD